jgi:ABC-type bacteriocin/lantibiotic exporter with double-glycine peptidase domain
MIETTDIGLFFLCIILTSLAVLVAFAACSPGGRRQVSVVVSESPADDGAACLTMILSFHGRQVTLDGVRGELGDDDSALGLVKAAERRGLKARGVLVSRADDFLALPVPSVLHWTDKPGRLTGELDPSRSAGSFVVIERASQLGLVLIDPLRLGRRQVTLDEAAAHTTGVVVVFGDVKLPGVPD